MKLNNVIAAAVAMLVPVVAATAAEPVQSIEINAQSLPFVRNVDDRYQSFQIGMSHLTGGETWRTYDANEKAAKPAASFDAVREARAPADLASPRLRKLASALAPFYLRYGGTTSNSVYFQDDDKPALAKAPAGFSVVLTRAGWKGGLDFAKAIDAKVVTGFAVSDGVRDANGVWTPRTAAPWLAYTRSIGGQIFAAEMFNEPNAPEPGRMPKGQAPEAFARDYAAFRSFIRKTDPEMKLVGPGTVTLGVSVPSLGAITAEQYLAAKPAPTFDIISYHFYGALAERCAPPRSPMGISADDALSEQWLARPDAQIRVEAKLRDQYAPGAPIWITETGAAACGGPRWQPTFLDTFRYLDSLARLAKQGVDAVITHALISGSNGILDEKTFLPNADYWAAVLWRRLMGNRVLDAGSIRPGLHVYAHCMRNTSGGVTLLAINLDDAPAEVKVSGTTERYELSAPALESGTVMLNGTPLVLDEHDNLPQMNAVRAKRGAVSVAPTSIAFIAMPEAGNASCKIDSKMVHQ